ncbi:MAG: hypothetical protein RBT34_14220 [Anaerolineaceae bacterium]|jgi:hypothetical protein|nr:hypothetical protein [Anaerolineaceae bacterium]
MTTEVVTTIMFRWHVREWMQGEFVAYLSQRFEVIESGVVGHHDQYVIVRKVQ